MSTYSPGQLVYVDSRWPMSTQLGSTDDDGVVELVGARFDVTREGDALIIAALPAVVREEMKQTWKASKSKVDRRRGWVLMLLLPNGQLGWIRSDGNYPRVTSE